MELIGKQLGDYEVERFIGHGSMARVYRARQRSLGRRVAIKVLEEEIFTPGQKIKRFFREMATLARLEHPNIVPIYAAGEESPYYFFAMRLVRGGTLAHAIAQPVPLRLGFEWVIEICRGLAYAHRQDVVHRDLKPSNILLQDGVALLGDFGLARLRDVTAITQDGMVLGTPLYMSPEQTRGEEVSAASDCFSAGVLLYELLTGAHPFAPRKPSVRFDTAAQRRLFQRIQSGEFESPRARVPEFPEELEALIRRALAPDIAHRYQDAVELRDDLEALRESVVQLDAALGSPRSSEFRAYSRPPASTVDTKILFEPDESVLAPQTTAEGSSDLGCVGGRYRLLRELGSGGQGVVYQGHDRVLDREVAVKVLQGGWRADRDVAELFVHEARIAGRLNHPHIIQIYDYGIEDRSPFIAMQYVRGPSLDKLCSGGEQFPVTFALTVTAQTALALSYAHEAGVIHLDVKPGNILIQPSINDPSRPLVSGEALQVDSPHVVLTDFTMARLQATPSATVTPVADSSTAPPQQRAEQFQALNEVGALAVTSGYAPPELRGQRAAAGPMADIFSLGVVLHEMLIGERLFSADHPCVSNVRMAYGDVPLPSSRNPIVPVAVDRLCLRMLDADPAVRPSAGDVVETVRTALRDEVADGVGEGAEF